MTNEAAQEWKEKLIAIKMKIERNGGREGFKFTDDELALIWGLCLAAVNPKHTADELKLGVNNACVKEVCPWCHSMFRPDADDWYFLKTSGEPVCEECIKSVGLKIAPAKQSDEQKAMQAVVSITGSTKDFDTLVAKLEQARAEYTGKDALVSNYYDRMIADTKKRGHICEYSKDDFTCSVCGELL
jgi:hypothetical protein